MDTVFGQKNPEKCNVFVTMNKIFIQTTSLTSLPQSLRIMNPSLSIWKTKVSLSIWINSCDLSEAPHQATFSLKLFVNQIAVSLGETFSGPNGFNNTVSSSNRSCCNSCALNSSNPSNASALCT